jgi:hypothetical protein
VGKGSEREAQRLENDGQRKRERHVLECENTADNGEQRAKEPAGGLSPPERAENSHQGVARFVGSPRRPASPIARVPGSIQFATMIVIGNCDHRYCPSPMVAPAGPVLGRFTD